MLREGGKEFKNEHIKRVVKNQHVKSVVKNEHIKSVVKNEHMGKTGRGDLPAS